MLWQQKGRTCRCRCLPAHAPCGCFCACMYDEPEENMTLDELAAVAAVAAARQSGRREVSAIRPRRECSTAAADALARDELELEQALADAEAEEGERRRSWELAQRLEAVEAEKEELELERLRLEHQMREDAAAAQAAAQAAAAKLAKQKALSDRALAKARGNEAEWRSRFSDIERELYEERRKPDERVRSQNVKALAARAAAEARAAAASAESKQLAKQKALNASAFAKARTEANEWHCRAANLEEQLYDERRKPYACVHSQNVKARAECAAAEAQAAAASAESERLLTRHVSALKALERERQARKESNLALVEEQQHHERERKRLERECVDALRQQDSEWRSNNTRALKAAAEAEGAA